MAVPPKPDPEKYCKHCTVLLRRKRMNGRLEDLAVFVRRVFCNRKCMAQAMNKATYSSLSYSRSRATKTMREACEICGSTGVRHVHHKDGNPLNNTPENLQTLCASCHRLSHSPNYMGTPLLPKPCAHCFRPVARKGLCNTHLTRLKRYGDPLLRKFKTASGWELRKADS